MIVVRLETIAMKFVVVTKDEEVKREAERAFHPEDRVTVTDDWRLGLDACEGADMIFVDQLATLDIPHKIAGYEKFAEAKMAHPDAATVPLTLIWPPEGYELDYMTGYPNFIFQHIQRPVTFQKVRRASTYV